MGRDAALAVGLFHEQSAFLRPRLSEETDRRLLCIFLNSINRSIYSLALHTLELSLHQCCYDNSRLICDCTGWDEFLRSGETVIRRYCAAFPCTQCSSVHVEKAKFYVDQHLTESLTLDEVAEQVFVSRAHLSHLFSCAMGMTFSAYVTTQRIARAKRLLRSTARTVQEISVLCGFASPAYFATVFKRYTGSTPKAFRAVSREKGGVHK